MFNFQVFQPYTLFGHPGHLAILECDGVTYLVMFSNGYVYSNAGDN